MSTDKAYIICEVCKGSGKIKQSECVDFHHNDYIYWDEKCVWCDGYGRLHQTTEVTTRKLTKKDVELREKKEE